jgi:hypothetical protein
MADKTKLENFVGELTQSETADLVTVALAVLNDELAVETVTEWAASAALIDELKAALRKVDEEVEDEEEDEEDEETS